MSYQRFIVKESNDKYPKVISYHIEDNEKVSDKFLKDMKCNKYIEVEISKFQSFIYGEVFLWGIQNTETHNIECYCVQDAINEKYFEMFGYKWDGSGVMFKDYEKATTEFIKLVHMKKTN